MQTRKLSYLSILLIGLLYACGQSNTVQDENTSHLSQDTTMQIVNDIHTFAQPDQVVMKHLKLDIEVDFDQKIIKGRADLDIDNKTQAEALFLDTKNLKIEKVTLEGNEQEAEFDLAKPFEHLGSALKIKIKPETKQVNIYYETSPEAEALQWLAPQQTADTTHPFLFTQSQAILARSWIPCQDSPGIRFSYEAKVKVPADLMAVMSAQNPTEKNEEGIYEFKMPQPIPAYLLALTVGDLRFEAINERTGVYAEPSVLKRATYEFAELPEMLQAAEDLYGPYRWERYDLIVLPPSFPFGGMENPRLTFATPTILAGDRSLTSLVAHELAHSWSGNLVTNATWNDFWLNEGFTVYFERRIMESLYGEDYADMLEYLGYQDLQNTLDRLGKDHADTQLKLDLQGRNPDDGVTVIAYEKGYFLLRTIEEEIGRAKMDTFLRAYFEKFAFETMTTEQFIDYIQEQLPEAKNVGLSNWIYSPNLPDNCVAVKSARFEQVATAVRNWQEGQQPQQLSTLNWSSHEWLYFLRSLPEEMTLAQMKELDEAFHFTDSGNAEILAAWLGIAVRNDYKEAYPALRNFLVEVGRRKFLVPLYKALIQNEEGKKLALEIYKEARPNYHYVSVSTLDELLGYNA